VAKTLLLVLLLLLLLPSPHASGRARGWVAGLRAVNTNRVFELLGGLFEGAPEPVFSFGGSVLPDPAALLLLRVTSKLLFRVADAVLVLTAIALFWSEGSE
jgi:hypothetical protein